MASAKGRLDVPLNTFTMRLWLSQKQEATGLVAKRAQRLYQSAAAAQAEILSDER